MFADDDYTISATFSLYFVGIVSSRGILVRWAIVAGRAYKLAVITRSRIFMHKSIVAITDLFKARSQYALPLLFLESI
jgi:hypothetical protein